MKASNEFWRERLSAEMPPDLAREIDIYETEIELRKQGKLDEKLFAETRLRRGAYGQRYDNGQRHDGVELRIDLLDPRERSGVIDLVTMKAILWDDDSMGRRYVDALRDAAARGHEQKRGENARERPSIDGHESPPVLSRAGWHADCSPGSKPPGGPSGLEPVSSAHHALCIGSMQPLQPTERDHDGMDATEITATITATRTAGNASESSPIRVVSRRNDHHIVRTNPMLRGTRRTWGTWALPSRRWAGV